MDEHEHIHRHVQRVGHPEITVRLLSDGGVGKDEDDRDHQHEEDARDARHCAKDPIAEGWLAVRLELQLLGHASQVLDRLRGDVVEVDAMSHRVDYCFR